MLPRERRRRMTEDVISAGRVGGEISLKLELAQLAAANSELQSPETALHGNSSNCYGGKYPPVSHCPGSLIFSGSLLSVRSPFL